MRGLKHFALVMLTALLALALPAQVTTSSIGGTIKDDRNIALAGATVEAVHEPSGTTYRTVTKSDGKFNIFGMRVGGPYRITITFVGFKKETYNDVYLQLGTPLNLDAALVSEAGNLTEVVVATGKKNKLISGDKKGTGTNISRRTLESMPTLNRSINDFVRLTPQSNGLSFAGQDNRFNNLTIDGSIFNNSFGLSGLPGGQTNSTPISLDALEEIQVNLSSVNLKDAGFTGAGINAVTRSGTNKLHGSVFYNRRNESFVGSKAKGAAVSVADFDVKQFGFRLGGPIIKNKLFFFVNAEAERRSDPGTAFKSNDNNGTNDANETRVLTSDLVKLQSFLKDSLKYDPGTWQDYSLETYSNKATAKIDWNVNDRNKFNIRFNYLRSYRDVPMSNSTTLGGNRNGNLQSMSFSNSNYIINNDIYSIVAELNTNYNNRVSNNIIAGYTANRDYRSSNGGIFPLVDILNGGQNYVSFGYEPFTANNKLNTDTWQFSDNLTFSLKGHTISAGVNFEHFRFLNVFTPFAYGRYGFNSLSDFYTAARAFIANPNLTTSPVQLNNYRLQYSALPGAALYDANLRANSIGAYVQDEFSPDENFRITYGFRVDMPFFKNPNPQANDSVAAYSFKDELGNNIKLNTTTLPGNNLLFSPRAGFNWDVNGNKTTQIRGVVGLYAGRPAFVWISNMLSNNGVQAGLINNSGSGANGNPFNTNVTRYIPTNVTVPAPSYNIAPIDKNFKFPQLFRGNLAIDQQFANGIVATVEGVVSHDVNNVGYINANLTNAIGAMPGPDKRPIYNSYNAAAPIAGAPNDRRTFRSSTTNFLRINSKVTDAILLKNINGGYSYALTVKIEKPYTKGINWMLAYNYGVAQDFISAGSIAFSSWADNFSVRGNNLPDLAYSNNDQRHRIIGNIGYRKEVFKTAAFSVNLFGEARNLGRYSYTYAGDMNGDGNGNNDLIFVPANTAAMNFVDWIDMRNTTDQTKWITYTAQQQRDAFEAFINQDDYLKNRRGQYAERNGALLPWVLRFDLSATLEFFRKINGERHTIQLRADIFNVGNLINDNWGVARISNLSRVLDVTNIPVNPSGDTRVLNLPTGVSNSNSSRSNPVYDSKGILYRMVPVNNSLNYSSFRNSASLSDIWQMQLGVRYIF